jgi:uracil phosphoribosyltransferase
LKKPEPKTFETTPAIHIDYTMAKMDETISDSTTVSTATTNDVIIAKEKVYIAGSASGDNYGVNVIVSSHPVLMHKISILRSSSTISSAFRSVLKEITYQLGYEATMSLTTRPVNLTVPIGHDHIECVGKKLVEKVALIPIMRSGLGMVDSMLELVPSAGVHHIGFYKQNSMPVQYYNRLPKRCDSDVAYVMDLVMKSAETMLCVVGILKKWGVTKIHIILVIASKQGLEKLASLHPDVSITVGQVDGEVSDKHQVLPGIGDSSDRLFATPLIHDEDEELMHVSKRKRTMD